MNLLMKLDMYVRQYFQVMYEPMVEVFFVFSSFVRSRLNLLVISLIFSRIVRSCLNLSCWWNFLCTLSGIVRSCLNLFMEPFWYPLALLGHVWTCCQNRSWYSPALSGHVWTRCCWAFIPVLPDHVWTCLEEFFFFDYSSAVRSCTNLLLNLLFRRCQVMYELVVEIFSKYSSCSESCVNLLSKYLVF